MLVFENLKQKYPKLVEILTIPLPPVENDKYENWHTKVLRQIRAFNVHTEKVVKAKTAIQEDEFFVTQAAKAKIRKTESIAVYEAKFVEFWRKTDTEGELSIKLASNHGGLPNH